MVYANNQLTQVQGLSGDSSWASGLNFGDNNILQEVAFNSPIRNVIGSITFLDNPLLDTFTNFHTLETIGESFQIKGSGIQDLSGFSSLTEVAGDLRIENNPLMKTLARLEGLQAVKGELRISDHPALTKIEDFSLLTTVGSITVANNSALEDSFSVPLLEDVGRFLVVSGNAALTSLPNFDSLKAIEKGLYIYGNPQLKNLVGLGGLRAVNGVVILKNNLSTINDLAQLESVNGNMFIEEPSLEDPILLNNLVDIQKVVIGAPTPILKVAESNGKSSQEAPSVYMYATDINNFKSRICTNETYESPEDLSGCYYVAGTILLKDIPGLQSLDFLDSRFQVITAIFLRNE